MKHILSSQNRELLAQIAWSRVLLGFDFDGTLAPIVADPDHAVVRASTRILLKKISKLYPCVVISGRSMADVEARLSGTGVAEVIGNHGIEPSASSATFLRQVAGWHQRLIRQLSAFRGVMIENKALSIAVHYRHSREKKKARAAILAAASAL